MSLPNVIQLIIETKAALAIGDCIIDSEALMFSLKWLCSSSQLTQTSGKENTIHFSESEIKVLFCISSTQICNGLPQFPVVDLKVLVLCFHTRNNLNHG